MSSWPQQNDLSASAAGALALIVLLVCLLTVCNLLGVNCNNYNNMLLFAVIQCYMIIEY